MQQAARNAIDSVGSYGNLGQLNAIVLFAFITQLTWNINYIALVCCICTYPERKTTLDRYYLIYMF